MNDSINILIAEGDRNLALILSDLFQKEGYSLSTSTSESNLYSKLENHSYDLIVISQNISSSKDIDRLISKIIHNSTKLTKTIVLLNERNVSLMLTLIANGVDDLLWKPLHPKELLFRCRNTLRMINYVDPKIIKRGKIILDQTRGLLTVDDAMIQLSRTELFILRKLLQRGYDYIDLDTLTKHIKNNFDQNRSRNSTRVAISRLRGKIQKQSGYELIRNRRERGYYLSL